LDVDGQPRSLTPGHTAEGPFPGEDSLNHLFFMNTTYNDGTVHTIPRIIYCSKYLGWGDYVAETPLAQLTPEDKATRGQPNGCPLKCFGDTVALATAMPRSLILRCLNL
jgi:hypothetical protein